MKVEQFVTAYGVEQDRIRALLPEGFVSLRPVLRINAEIRSGKVRSEQEQIYLEFNTPVEAYGKRGWLNIGNWNSDNDGLTYVRSNRRVTFTLPFLTISYTGTGLEGGCPAEKDNAGCFFKGEKLMFRPAEHLTVGKEYCDCEFAWKFTETDAHGVSEGKTLPAYCTEPKVSYRKEELTAGMAAAIPCIQVLGAYKVIFDRIAEEFENL